MRRRWMLWSAVVCAAAFLLLACQPDRTITPHASRSVASVTTGNVPWHLDRIDQAWLPFDRSYDNWTGGAGVDLYFIDTGVQLDHPEFAGRASLDVDLVHDGYQDCNGHGTHVVSIAAGTTAGVAPFARIHMLKVYGCSGDGPDANIVTALDWITANGVHPGVISLSIAADTAANFPAVDSAVQRAIDAGFVVVASAGNNAGDACAHAPGQVAAAITVAASRSNDAIASYSNQGACVDVIAPGDNLYSAQPNGTYGFLGGTSAAAPVVAGIAALYLSANPLATVAAVTSWIVSQATPGAIDGLWPSTPNLLVRTTRNGQPLPPPPVMVSPRPPSAILTVMSCTGLTCSFTSIGSATQPDNSLRSDFDFGDHKKVSYVTSVSHTYSKAGTYIVTLTITDASGRKASTTQAVTVSGTLTSHR